MEEISDVNAWKVSVKLGHSFGARGEPEVPHIGRFNKFPSPTVSLHSASQFPEAQVMCVSPASPAESASPVL